MGSSSVESSSPEVQQMSENTAAVRVADPRARRKIALSPFTRLVKVHSILFSFLFLLYGNAAQAQSADGFLNTLKGIVNDPVVNSMLMSKASSILGGAARTALPNQNYRQQADYGAGGFASAGADPNYGYGYNPSPNAPSAGFYSIENGARLGGVGYDPSLYQSSQYAPPMQSMAQSQPSQGLLSRLPGILSPAMNRFANPVNGTSMPLPPATNSFGASDNGMTITKKLAPAELQQLSHFDLSVLIDRSGSMNTRDCPDIFSGKNRALSRWEWCREQTAMLARQTAGALPAGITVVPFSSKAVRYENASPQVINNIFNATSPEGSTNLADALRLEFDRYFQDRDAGFRSRPLMIAVITDGVPDSKGAVRRVIEEATQRMNSPQEIRICFFLIGDDRAGEDFVDELVDSFDNNNSRVQMIVRHPFAEVNQVGLPRSLAFAAKG